MEISEAAKDAATMILNIGCTRYESVSETVQQAINEVTADKDAEIKRLRSLQYAVGICAPDDVPESVYHAWQDASGYRECVLKQRDAEIDRLRQVLRRLMSVQNGPPLEKHKGSWNEAIEMARQVLTGGEESDGYQ